jgi:aminopeptidase N
MKFAILVVWVLQLILFHSCKHKQTTEIVPGVSLEIAEHRKSFIDSLNYHLYFAIPQVTEQKVTGKAIVHLYLNKKPDKLIMDFNAPEEYLQEVRVNQITSDYLFMNEHIIIPGKFIQSGYNLIEIDFTSTDQALNRQNEFMYTLFVPDRASTAFPCFDQPDLKARFQLELNIPPDWKSVANGMKVSETISETEKHVFFANTEPLPTYLFSFAAGMFDTISAEKNGRRIVMYHRETDADKLIKNKQEIFDQHFAALDWLENYTGIEYPFSKFDFVAIPFFQYGGMEHPGAILYRGSRLFLDDHATQNELLSRANLIAHETAHMWFGDLVTMRWFNDVWMKEVFANFLADKIVNPRFPELNHRQRFLYAHFPRAYEIDRTPGANPIRQELDNMKNAGTLYGNIIYHKAPIMMNQLEKILGEEVLRKGLQQYLSEFAHANADWPELISILDALTEIDLKGWSNTWVEEPGMPWIDVQVLKDEILVQQTDPSDRNRLWNQILSLKVAKESEIVSREIHLKDEKVKIDYPIDEYRFIFPDGSGEGYGYFRLDEITMDYLLNNLQNEIDPLLKAVSILSLWEEMLHGRIPPEVLHETILRALQTETDALNSERLLQQLRMIYWKFLTKDKRAEQVERSEEFLLERIAQVKDRRLKNNYFRAFTSVSGTANGLKTLYDIWSGRVKMDGITLSENDYIGISLELAVKMPEQANAILEQQLGRISNPDRKESFLFVMPALSPDKAVRDAFFESLKLPENRKVEPRVLQALEHLHHPLRSEESMEYIRPSLDMLEEIQLTGDIFFPTNWLNATLVGYQNEEAKQIVENFLNEHPDYPANLRGKILQSADMLYRAVDITKKSGQ